jgi:hypothetical protein
MLNFTKDSLKTPLYPQIYEKSNIKLFGRLLVWAPVFLPLYDIRTLTEQEGDRIYIVLKLCLASFKILSKEEAGSLCAYLCYPCSLFLCDTLKE